MSTYSIDTDVTEKYAHLTTPTNVVISNFRKDSYNYINARIRSIYSVPVVSTDESDKGILRVIESKLSAGNILMSVAAVQEAENLHSYAESLIKDAENLLTMLVDESMQLSSLATRDTSESTDDRILQGSAPDSYATFDRPMSGVDNDAIEGIVDSEKYNSLEDVKTL
jgi:short-subunit dehydrogenase involved in D-alanine esterification of teichoic acids